MLMMIDICNVSKFWGQIWRFSIVMGVPQAHCLLCNGKSENKIWMRTGGGSLMDWKPPSVQCGNMTIKNDHQK